jgi:hypothetical protein
MPTHPDTIRLERLAKNMALRWGRGEEGDYVFPDAHKIGFVVSARSECLLEDLRKALDALPESTVD